MMGDDKDPGVIPRAMQSVFSIIQNVGQLILYGLLLI